MKTEQEIIVDRIYKDIERETGRMPNDNNSYLLYLILMELRIMNKNRC